MVWGGAFYDCQCDDTTAVSMGMTISAVSMVMKMAAVSLKFVVDFFLYLPV